MNCSPPVFCIDGFEGLITQAVLTEDWVLSVTWAFLQLPYTEVNRDVLQWGEKQKRRTGPEMKV